MNERDGVVHDFTRKGGVEHCEIVLPHGMHADWALDRSALWNAAEHSENRKDSRVAREFEIALPHELSEQGRIEAARIFAQHVADRYGSAVDFAVHAPHEQGDIRNYHAHVMMTTRQVGQHRFGEKTILEHKNARLLSQGLPTTDMQLRDIRQTWETIANVQLQREGWDIRIDHRSHIERGLELVPTEHMGVNASQMQRKGMGVERARLDEEAALRNAELIREKPEQVLTLISQEKSVFDRHDIARALHRYINDDQQAFQNAFASVMASSSLVLLQAERMDDRAGEGELARYSTREMLELERAMADGARRLAHARSHGVDRHHVDQAMRLQDDLIGARTARSRSGEQDSEGVADREVLKRPGLSEEQKAAIRHITGSEGMAVVVGFAGAGKSTMLAAARDAWERQGYKVHGAALSGKAAEGLAESSGIASRTLASWTHGWQRDRGLLGRGDVFVIDEAGMIGSRQLSRFVAEAEARGAKIVLVGDHEQLQAMGAGAPFRAIAEQIGYAELSEIRRQKIDWQRAASVSFATHKTAEALASYRDHGDIHFAPHRDEARAAIVRDYLADREQHPDDTRVAMAHRRADVRALNAAIRTSLQDSHQLGRGEEGGEFTFQTNDGPRSFVPGDRVVFLENSRELGVKNGMLGEVKAIERNALHIRLDGAGAEASAEASFVKIPINDYQAIDHGYATTIHKNQGATVDRAFVLASGTMDRHLTYVAMTRHRDGVGLYVDAEEFLGRAGGKLLDHGAAPYKHQAGNRESYFVTLENDKGQRSTVWGVELGPAMRDTQPAIGERIDLQQHGAKSVMLSDGTQSQRHSWRVIKGDDLAYQELESRLSRSGAKETTLDYVQAFAERREIADQFGVRSQIQLDEIQEPEHHKRSLVANTIREAQDKPTRERSSFVERTPSQGRPGPLGDHHVDGQQRHVAADAAAQKRHPQRRSIFAGLKLSAGANHTSGSAAQGVGQDISDRPEPGGLAERIRPLSGFEQAVDRYAQAFSAAQRQVEQGLPLLEVQRQEIARAAQTLDQARPGSHDLIRSALQHDPRTADAMTELSGRQRVTQLVAGMDRERAALSSPDIRADRFVQQWQALQAERQALEGWRHVEARGKLEEQMRTMIKELGRDVQVDVVLQGRARDLGIRTARQGETMASAMKRELSQARSQNLSLER